MGGAGGAGQGRVRPAARDRRHRCGASDASAEAGGVWGERQPGASI